MSNDTLKAMKLINGTGVELKTSVHPEKVRPSLADSHGTHTGSKKFCKDLLYENRIEIRQTV
jgi:hypothetical protein